MIALILRLCVTALGILFLWPFLIFARKKLNAAKTKLNAAGLPATPKNIFFLEASIEEAKRKESEALLAECELLDLELEDARASRKALASSQQGVKNGSG